MHTRLSREAVLVLIALTALATGCVEVPERPDARVLDAAADLGEPPDGAGPEMGAACVASEETCNGVDDDCDGDVDEADVELCTPCVVPREVGACAEGRMVCAEGRLECRSLGAPPATGCDLIDGDCDGRWDEAGEEPALRDRLVARQCPGAEAEWTRAPDPGVCPDGEVGCGGPHPCLDRACVDGCDDRFGLAYAECAQGCGAGTRCRADCRSMANATRQACIADCPPVDRDGARWTCEPGEDGPVCAVVACRDSAVFEDGQCQRIERCNDGIDDDGDGLVDGTVLEPGRCQAVYLGGGESLIGGCPAGVPGCDTIDGANAPLWSCGADCPYSPLLSYDYALDREEVSNRAWFSCFRDGACTEPAGASWRQARVIMESEAGPPARPADPPCGASVRIDPREGSLIDPQVVDLPVAGVSWCQARDFCLWAGKRLPTEVEWERAAGGTTPRRLWPWGEASPAACSAAQCCGTEGEPPATCGPGPLPACPEAPAGGPIRAACLATMGQGDPGCNPRDPACPECLPSPAPVWANRDGATPEGVLNLMGNVAEWTFDWASLGYGGASDLDPVGAACNQLTIDPADDTPEGRPFRGPGQRITRGGDYLRLGIPGPAFARAPFPPGARLPAVGFRCARTLDQADSGRPVLCDPGTQGQPPPPIPPDPPPAPRPDCPAPEFDDDLGAAGVCPGNSRVPSGTCLEGQGRTCATDRPIDCGAFLIRRMAVDFGSIDRLIDRVRPFLPGGIALQRPTLDEFTVEFIGRLFDGDLIPNGGQTIIALETGCGFGGNGIFPSRLVNGAVVGDAFVEMGVAEGANCTPLETPRISVVTQEPGVVDNVCRLARGEVYILGVGARLPYTATMLFDAGIDVARGEFGGTLMYIVTLRDAADSTLGDDNEGGVRDFMVGAGAPPADLCVLQQLAFAIDSERNPERAGQLGTWACSEFDLWPGCVNGFCQGINGDRSMCTGWLAPIRFQATARERFDRDFAACSCADGDQAPR